MQAIVFPICQSFNLLVCRLSALFWSGTWVSIGEWELNGLKRAYWIMIPLRIMAIGHMEQVSVSYVPLLNLDSSYWIAYDSVT